MTQRLRLPRFTALALTCLLPLSTALAALPADFAACQQLQDDTERLRCFDALTATSASATAPAETEAETQKPVAASPQRAEDQFGAETLPKSARTGDETEPKAIHSRILGKFNGWESDTVFELENGQVWKCQSCRSVYVNVQDPEVTIKRSFLGSYWLGIEGLNSKARVKRLR